MLNKWKIFFKKLRAQRLYSRQSLPDCIAMLAIYLPIIREQVTEFVRIWNIHIIRKQPNRPHVVCGQPFQNYFFPKEGVKCYGIPVDIDKLRELRKGYEEWDINAYLPKDTLQFCQEYLVKAGFTLPITESSRDASGDIAHLPAYLMLRDEITHHISTTSNLIPKLGLLPLPIGAYDWVPHPEVAIGLAEARAKDYNDQDGVQFMNEGRDVLDSDRDFVHFPDSDEENEDLEIANELRIEGTSFRRVPGTTNWLVDGIDVRQHMDNGHASEREDDSEEDLALPPPNIRRFIRPRGNR
jgi:hypothetical protein